MATAGGPSAFFWGMLFDLKVPRMSHDAGFHLQYCHVLSGFPFQAWISSFPT
jgi:hypothetical protein